MNSIEEGKQQIRPRKSNNEKFVCYWCCLLCCFISIYFYIHLDLIKVEVTTQDQTMTLLLTTKTTKASTDKPKATTTLPSSSSTSSVPSSSSSSSSVTKPPLPSTSSTSSSITKLETTTTENQKLHQNDHDHDHHHGTAHYNIQLNTTCYDIRNESHVMEYTYPQGIPTFIIAGQHKCGTTALFKILQTHPNLLPSNVFESHFFDQLSLRPSRHKYFNKNFINRYHLRQKRQRQRREKKDDGDLDIDPTTIQQSAICYEQYNYAKENFNVPTMATTIGSDNNNNNNNSNEQENTIRKVVYNISNQQKQRRRRKRNQLSLQSHHLGSFEKTPAYISYQYSIPILIKMILPWTKIIISLRNPIDRLTSDIVKKLTEARNKMKKEEPNGTATTIVDVVDNDNVNINERYDEYDTFFEYAVGSEYRSRMKNITAIMMLEAATTTTTTSSHKEDDSSNSENLRQKQKSQLFQSRNLIRDGIVRGIYIEQIEPWLEYFTLGKDILIVPYETFVKRPQHLLDEIHEFVNIPYYNYTPDVLYYDHSPNLRPHEQGLYNISLRQSKLLSSGLTTTVISSSEGGGGGGGGGSGGAGGEGGSGGAASSSSPSSASSSASSSSSRPIIPDYFRKELHQFYKPYNDRLFDLLKDDPRFYPNIWDE